MERNEKLLKKKKIAVFANGWSIEYLSMVIEGIRKEAKKDNVDIFVFVTYILCNESEESNKCQLNIFHLPEPDDFDGAIALTNTFNLADELERINALFVEKGVPMVSTEIEVDGMA